MAQKEPVNILIVDDRAANLLAMETILKGPDLCIFTAQSGNDALSALLEHEFACILVDVKMPDMSGFELAEILRKDERTINLPVIFISGHHQSEHDVFKGYETGAVDYLVKPINPVVVRSKVAAFAELFRREREIKRANQELCKARAELEKEVLERARALAKSEETLRLAVDSGRLGVWAYDFAIPTAEWSDRCREILGYPKGKPVSLEAFYELVNPEDRDRVRQAVDTSFDPKHGGGYYAQYRVVSASGGDRWITASGQTYFDESGKPARFLGAVQDITDQKSTELALKRQAEELARSNRELEQFAFISSHDLKEPLRMVSTYVQLIQKNYGSRFDGTAGEYFGFVLEGASRMWHLIEDLLQYSQVGRESGDLVEIDTSGVVQVVLKNLGAQLEETHARIVSSPLPAIWGRQSQLYQLFQNLISNALKFRGSAPPEITISAAEEDDLYHFSVRDNGIGIKPEYQQKIFLIFQRLHTRDEYPGTGIGLSVCKKIVELHGGRIWVESALSKGSTFHFTFPKRRQHAWRNHASREDLS